VIILFYQNGIFAHPFIKKCANSVVFASGRLYWYIPSKKALFYCWMPTVWNTHIERKTLNHFVSTATIELVLTTADTMNPITKGLLFVAGWTAVQVLCFDAGGVVLGIFFGGVPPAAYGGLQDYQPFGALGVSTLIGVFASQLASETWDSNWVNFIYYILALPDDRFMKFYDSLFRR
jgi:hypothetical protein